MGSKFKLDRVLASKTLWAIGWYFHQRKVCNGIGRRSVTIALGPLRFVFVRLVETEREA